MRKIVDKRPTMAEWPIKIWSVDEIPEVFRKDIESFLDESFNEYKMVYSPVRSTAPNSFEYLFAYGKGELFYWRNYEGKIKCVHFQKEQIVQVNTKCELLDANISVKYRKEKLSEETTTLDFPYISTVYYHFDPFLNWLLNLQENFNPLLEDKYPRLEELKKKSLVMYNYAQRAYRLGNVIETYQYEYKEHRKKWLAWKKSLEEWLEIPMSKGVFKLHNFGYLTECEYNLIIK